MVGRAVRHAPFGRERDHPRRGHRVRIEHRRIDAARDDPDTGGIDAVPHLDHARDMPADGDHQRAPRHHRVVAPLERQILVVAAVIGGYELHPGPARGDPCGPGRRARPGMHDVHPLATDHLPQPGGVAPDAPRILCRQAQQDVASTRPLDGGRKPSPGTGHQRQAAAARDGARHLHGPALHPAAA